MIRLSGLLGVAWALVAWALVACGQGPEGPAAPPPDPPAAASAVPPSAAAPPAAERCPAEAPAPDRLPGVTPEQRSLRYWLDTLGARFDLDAPLLDAAGVARLNAAARTRPHGPEARIEDDLTRPIPEDSLRSLLEGRLVWMRAQLEEGRYISHDGQPFPAEFAARHAIPEGWRPGPGHLHVALESIPLRCGPAPDGLYKAPTPDLAFDRNQCSQIHPQEPVEVLGPWPGDRLLVRTPYVLGWIAASAPLSPALSPDEARALLAAPRALAQGPTELRADGARLMIPLGHTVALLDGAAWFATPGGLRLAPVPATLQPVDRPLTRRALLEAGFAWLDRPYGWGGAGGGQDCSRFLLDLFAGFGIALPRNSAHQPHVASFVLDVRAVEDEAAKLRLVDAAQARGVVLLHFPGHIMLYLGRDADGRPMALHSFAEYLEPCAGGGETLRRVHKVTVSDLELGRGTSRRAFSERITHIAVFGGDPGPALAGLATERPAAPVAAPARCRAGTRDFPALTGPAHPHAGQPLRLMAAPMAPVGPVELVLIDPTGALHRPPLGRLPGPPYVHFAQMPEPLAGTWTAAWGDGDRILHCERIEVAPRPRPPGPVRDTIWPVRDQWGPKTEALFSAFVARLFDYPLDDDRTWDNLHSLLADPARNLLYDHLSLGEDQRLRLQPDCADLPYYLRAYFAWKLGLPFGYRTCSRGRDDRAPRCGPLLSQARPPRASDPLQAAAAFIKRDVKGAVHSSSARTLPADDASDTYPLPLSREAIRPGVTFADPYGHLLVVTGWIPQGATTPGLLMAADAQPDGTIGRRRFWQGSFLFTPETQVVGAGFKGWRPVYFDAKTGETVARDNAWLATAKGFPRWSDAQYAGSAADFYDRIEALMNPRPLDPFARQAALIEALDEVVARRVQAVANGEAFMRGRGFAPIPMPKGADIFLTSGPWEDFSTPSRDLRLLISIHTVVDFAASVRRRPERFGVAAAEAEALAARVAAARDAALAARSFQYADSAGQPVTLSLAELVARRVALEVAYNPNDCMEHRWGAPPGSLERARCTRSAPAAQRAQMQRVRPWFADRRRPAR